MNFLDSLKKMFSPAQSNTSQASSDNNDVQEKDKCGCGEDCDCDHHKSDHGCCGGSGDHCCCGHNDEEEEGEEEAPTQNAQPETSTETTNS